MLGMFILPLWDDFEGLSFFFGTESVFPFLYLKSPAHFLPVRQNTILFFLVFTGGPLLERMSEISMNQSFLDLSFAVNVSFPTVGMVSKRTLFSRKSCSD